MEIDKCRIEEMFKEFGVCQEWTSKFQSLTTDEEIVKFYLKNIEFCFENNFPENRFLLKYREMLRKNNVFFDEAITINNPWIIGCLGACSGEIHYTNYNVGQAYVKDSSHISIVVKNSSFVTVFLFEGAKIDLQIFDKSKAIIMDYGGQVHCRTDDTSIIKTLKPKKEKS